MTTPTYNFTIVLLVIITGSIASGKSERCALESLTDCIKSSEPKQYPKAPKRACAILKTLVPCLQSAAKACGGDAKQIATRKEIEILKKVEKSACSRQNQREELIDVEGMVKCVKTAFDKKVYLTHVSKCSRITARKAIKEVGNERDKSCSSHLTFFHCLSRKMAEKCGQSLERPYFHELLLAWAERNGNVAKCQQCLVAVLEATLDDANPIMPLKLKEALTHQ